MPWVAPTSHPRRVSAPAAPALHPTQRRAGDPIDGRLNAEDPHEKLLAGATLRSPCERTVSSTGDACHELRSENVGDRSQSALVKPTPYETYGG